MINLKSRVDALIEKVSVNHTQYKTWFECYQTRNEASVEVRCVSARPCSVNRDKEVDQLGRLFVVEAHMSDRAILRTLLLALLTFEEHEVREGFKFSGVALFEPEHT